MQNYWNLYIVCKQQQLYGPLIIGAFKKRAPEPISLFWAPNGRTELPEMRFEFPFNLIGKNWQWLF